MSEIKNYGTVPYWCRKGRKTLKSCFTPWHFTGSFQHTEFVCTKKTYRTHIHAQRGTLSSVTGRSHKTIRALLTWSLNKWAFPRYRILRQLWKKCQVFLLLFALTGTLICYFPINSSKWEKKLLTLKREIYSLTVFWFFSEKAIWKTWSLPSLLPPPSHPLPFLPFFFLYRVGASSCCVVMAALCSCLPTGLWVPEDGLIYRHPEQSLN